MPEDQPSSHGWTPDARTIIWAFGRAHEDGVRDAIREDVTRRGRDLEPNSEAYWNLVAEAAIESVLFDLAEKSREDGAVFTEDMYVNTPRAAPGSDQSG